MGGDADVNVDHVDGDNGGSCGQDAAMCERDDGAYDGALPPVAEIVDPTQGEFEDQIEIRLVIKDCMMI